ncbi:TonB-dependent receptor [Methylococcus sp. EFPC2]|uniref:TonB-dependent siderophore receptor n=1 Tax=Methylococcus sp. EFPC2 TaxID=2812648 RepID=UPI001966DC34|nr:TonB-dependent receptor [Methylococcus sp. EFPC2]QSA95767.1 TonB-dependent receptor [Methylococcus sp. EFPC2]
MKFATKPWVAAVLAVKVGAAIGADAEHRFDIPPQPLHSALQKLAEQASVAVFFAENQVADKRGPAVKGSYTTRDALIKLLGGSGLEFSVADDGSVAVKPAPQRINQSDPTALPKVKVTGKAAYDATDPYNPEYHQPNASTATKTDTPIMETPFSVKVVPQQVLKDQQIVRLDNALQNVAGVQAQPTNGQTSDSFIIRGFQNDTLYRNGFLLPSALGGGTSKRETANLERIEVLKGPASIMYGRTEPGGIINLVTKRPLATPYYSLQQQFGSYDFYRTTADATGPITHDDSLLYRINLAYENSDSFRDFQKADRVFVAPSLTWNVTPQTQANLDIEFQHFDETGDSGIPPIGNRPAPVPRSREVGEKLNNSNIGDRVFVGFDWSHRFNDDWKISHRFGAEYWDFKTLYTFFYTPADTDGILTSRGFNNGDTQQQEYYTTLNLAGKFNTAFIKHNVLFGFDYFTTNNQGQSNCCYSPSPDGFNLFNPTYLTAKPYLPLSPSLDITQDWYGLYFQDQVTLPYDVYANFGIRYDNATGRDNRTRTTTTSDDYVSPRGGLLWKPVQWLSLYGSYSENFGVSNSLWNSPRQKPLPPQTAQQWELGAKSEFLDGRLSATYAYFDLTKQNMGVSDWSCAPFPCQRSIGEQQSRGHELEVAGEVLPGWRIIGAYTHLAYANINKDGFDGRSDNTGHRMFMTPRNFGSLWNTYEFQNGDLQGLKLGGGLVATSQSQGSNTNDFQIPGHAEINLLASYGMNVAGTRVTAQLNVNNLLDKTYYLGTNTGYMIGVGAPRTFLGSLRVEY